jgi:GPH family glycoside/pentoside/hexuronide:cation symporter
MIEEKFGQKQKISYSLAALPAWLIAAAYQVWVFSFYFSAIGLPIQYIMAAFILWSIWNAINDPIMGILSDRTKTRWGRRKPYILIGTIPLIIILTITWMPPTEDATLSFIYLLIMLFAYDTFETMIFVPHSCLFPELYTSTEERAEVNAYMIFFTVIGLICAFVIAGFLIGDITVKEGYLINGIVISTIVGLTLLISLKWGIVEREEFKFDSQQNFGYIQGLKYALNNRAFVLYVIIIFAFEYVQLLQATIVPQYSKHVLGEEGAMEAGIMLGIMFIVGIISLGFWRYLDLKMGSRSSFFIAIFFYMFSSIPLLFISNYFYGVIFIAIMGFGLGGLLYFSYLIIADIIDEDELKTGVRREGTFYGIMLFFMRLAGVITILSISLVFTSTGWETYDPKPNADVILGLRILMVVFPGIALGIMAVCLHFFPFSKSRIRDLKSELHEIHRKKRERLREDRPK